MLASPVSCSTTACHSSGGKSCFLIIDRAQWHGRSCAGAGRARPLAPARVRPAAARPPVRTAAGCAPTRASLIALRDRRRRVAGARVVLRAGAGSLDARACCSGPPRPRRRLAGCCWAPRRLLRAGLRHRQRRVPPRRPGRLPAARAASFLSYAAQLDLSRALRRRRHPGPDRRHPARPLRRPRPAAPPARPRAVHQARRRRRPRRRRPRARRAAAAAAATPAWTSSAACVTPADRVRVAEVAGVPVGGLDDVARHRRRRRTPTPSR